MIHVEQGHAWTRGDLDSCYVSLTGPTSTHTSLSEEEAGERGGGYGNASYKRRIK